MPEMLELGTRISSLKSLSELYHFAETIRWREILHLGACIQRVHTHYDPSQLQGNMSPSGLSASLGKMGKAQDSAPYHDHIRTRAAL